VMGSMYSLTLQCFDLILMASFGLLTGVSSRITQGIIDSLISVIDKKKVDPDREKKVGVFIYTSIRRLLKGVSRMVTIFLCNSALAAAVMIALGLRISPGGKETALGNMTVVAALIFGRCIVFKACEICSDPSAGSSKSIGDDKAKAEEEKTTNTPLFSRTKARIYAS
jgi:hypothetical protein